MLELENIKTLMAKGRKYFLFDSQKVNILNI